MICRISRFDSVWHFEENDELTGSKIKSNCSNKCTISWVCNGRHGWSCTRTGMFFISEPPHVGTFFLHFQVREILTCFAYAQTRLLFRIFWLKSYLGRQIPTSITNYVCMYYNTFGHCAFIFVDDCNMCPAKHWSSNCNKKMVKFPAP